MAPRRRGCGEGRGSRLGRGPGFGREHPRGRGQRHHDQGFEGQGGRADAEERSEEHTSELQSLMRNSYAVFCLKKKKTNIIYRDSKNVSVSFANNTGKTTHIS